MLELSRLLSRRARETVVRADQVLSRCAGRQRV
jgi:hypothetical protein